MIRRAAIHRRLGPWLIGLYVLAIVGGFIPLVTNYSAHSGAPSAISEIEGESLFDSENRRVHRVREALARGPTRSIVPAGS
jgi:hypothetical protein